MQIISTACKSNFSAITGSQAQKVNVRPHIEAPKDEIISNLNDENRKLREQIEMMKKKMATCDSPKASPTSSISYDLETNTLSMTGFKTRDMLIQNLQAEIKNGDRIEKELQANIGLSGIGLSNTGSLMPLIKNMSLDVRKFSIKVTSSDALKTILGKKKEELEKSGVKDLNLNFEPGNKLSVNGTFNKIISVPFSIDGRISVTDDNCIRFDVREINAGFLPVPDLIKSLVMSIAEDSLSDNAVKCEENSFLINTQALKPSNMNIKLKDLKTGDGFILAEG